MNISANKRVEQFILAGFGAEMNNSFSVTAVALSIRAEDWEVEEIVRQAIREGLIEEMLHGELAVLTRKARNLSAETNTAAMYKRMFEHKAEAKQSAPPPVGQPIVQDKPTNDLTAATVSTPQGPVQDRPKTVDEPVIHPDVPVRDGSLRPRRIPTVNPDAPVRDRFEERKDTTPPADAVRISDGKTTNTRSHSSQQAEIDKMARVGTHPVRLPPRESSPETPDKSPTVRKTPAMKNPALTPLPNDAPIGLKWLWHILLVSIRAIPVNNVVLGIVGVAAGVALVLAITGTPRTAAIGIGTMFVFMVAMLVLGQVYEHIRSTSRWIIQGFLVAMLLAFVFFVGMLISTFGWGMPEHAAKLLYGTERPPERPIINSALKAGQDVADKPVAEADVSTPSKPVEIPAPEARPEKAVEDAVLSPATSPAIEGRYITIDGQPIFIPGGDIDAEPR